MIPYLTRLQNLNKRDASLSMNGIGQTQLGLISSYDPNTYCVKVDLQPPVDEFGNCAQTNWIPLGTIWAGNGWGMFAAPNIGDQVIVHPQEGCPEALMASLFLYSDEDRPLPVPSGEFWLVHQSGSAIKLTNDGKISISSATEIDIDAPSVNITMAGGSVKNLVTEAFQALFNSHTHNTPDGESDAPTQQMDTTYLTQNLQAS